MSKRRKFTAAFKSQVVLQLLSGEKSMADVCDSGSSPVNLWVVTLEPPETGISQTAKVAVQVPYIYLS